MRCYWTQLFQQHSFYVAQETETLDFSQSNPEWPDPACSAVSKKPTWHAFSSKYINRSKHWYRPETVKSSSRYVTFIWWIFLRCFLSFTWKFYIKKKACKNSRFWKIKIQLLKYLSKNMVDTKTKTFSGRIYKAPFPTNTISSLTKNWL